MVEKTPDTSEVVKKPAEESKKVELIVTKQIPTESQPTADVEEETKNEAALEKERERKALLADQSKHNLPVNPDFNDLQDLLNVYIKKIKLPAEYAEKLKSGLAESQTNP